ncbi:disulfide bond corrector protein DsbC [compost metagenome]
MYSPVKWSYAAKKISKNEVVLFIKGAIEEGWHIYSLNQPNGGPLKTSFTFNNSADYALVGEAYEPQATSEFDKTFKIEVFYFEESVVFQQKIKLKKPKTIIKGKIVYMACTDGMCTPPLDIEFSIPIKS